MGNGMVTMSNAMVTAVKLGLWGTGSKSHKGRKDEALKEKRELTKYLKKLEADQPACCGLDCSEDSVGAQW